MKVNLCVLALLLFQLSLRAQMAFTSNAVNTADNFNTSQYTTYPLFGAARKLYQRNRGVIIGLQKGRYTSIELGGEAHWRKISLRNPRIIGATANMEYNFSNHVIGYKAGMWMKHGRVNLTYGANVAYFTDFKDKSRFGFGPAVGFRLAGFHLINGYNFLVGNKELTQVNTLYLTLRYYFPVDNQFVWDKKTRDKQKAKRKRKREREERRQEDKKGFFDFLHLHKSKDL